MTDTKFDPNPTPFCDEHKIKASRFDSDTEVVHLYDAMKLERSAIIAIDTLKSISCSLDNDELLYVTAALEEIEGVLK